ncbi:MAG TPA: serine hydrolase domain-containing protein [Caulobacteraceae bacterium]|nr:serine hydrolase domain-containing protein [Caulobacteraceae bacterium]
MSDWLTPALDYIPQWLELQVRIADLPGVSAAVVKDGEVVLAKAFGKANLKTGEALSSDHQFRIASHSKTFTATGVMRLVDEGRLRLDDRAGHYVEGLHADIARATIAQLLSHTAGVIRDGKDAGQWLDRRPFLSEIELRAALAEPPIIPANTRLKYSNHGYGLVGLIIEAATGESYASWIAREVVAASGLAHTFADAPTSEMQKLAAGHGSRLLLGERFVIPGRNPTNALAPATGFISTAPEAARFFASLDPAAPASVLSVEARRELTRRQWKLPDSALTLHYGLGTMHGDVGDWPWFGHAGGFQGFLTQTVALPGRGLALSILTNAADSAPGVLAEGVVRILQTFENGGAPSERAASWAGRWHNPNWGAADLAPVGDKVLLATPALPNPFASPSEIALTGEDEGVIEKAQGFANHGERVRRVRDEEGRVSEIWIAGTKFVSEADAISEVRARYLA